MNGGGGGGGGEVGRPELLFCKSVYKTDCLDQSLSLYLAQGSKAGQNDGSNQKAILYYLIRLVPKRHSLYRVILIFQPSSLAILVLRIKIK